MSWKRSSLSSSNAGQTRKGTISWTQIDPSFTRCTKMWKSSNFQYRKLELVSSLRSERLKALTSLKQAGTITRSDAEPRAQLTWAFIQWSRRTLVHAGQMNDCIRRITRTQWPSLPPRSVKFWIRKGTKPQRTPVQGSRTTPAYNTLKVSKACAGMQTARFILNISTVARNLAGISLRSMKIDQ